jgi:hypothetical protein
MLEQICIILGLIAFFAFITYPLLDYGPKDKAKTSHTLFYLANSPYLIDWTARTVLDVGRGLVFGFSEGLVSEVHQDLLTWESKRRIVHSSPTINMHLVEKALTGEQPALPMPKLLTEVKSESEVIEL